MCVDIELRHGPALHQAGPCWYFFSYGGHRRIRFFEPLRRLGGGATRRALEHFVSRFVLPVPSCYLVRHARGLCVHVVCRPWYKRPLSHTWVALSLPHTPLPRYWPTCTRSRLPRLMSWRRCGSRVRGLRGDQHSHKSARGQTWGVGADVPGVRRSQGPSLVSHD